MKGFNKSSALREFSVTVVMITGLLAVRWSFADQYRVPSGSMLPTIEVGDHLMVNKMAYDLRLPFTEVSLLRRGEPRRGDVVVFRYPQDPSLIYVKRVVGLPGDHLRIHNGWLEVNDVRAEVAPRFKGNFERFQQWSEDLNGRRHQVQRIPDLARPETFDFIVPAGQLFAMGDNRDDSSDSRVWGFVPRENLKGQVIAVGYSLDWTGWLPRMRWERLFSKVI